MSSPKALLLCRACPPRADFSSSSSTFSSGFFSSSSSMFSIITSSSCSTLSSIYARIISSVGIESRIAVKIHSCIITSNSLLFFCCCKGLVFLSNKKSGDRHQDYRKASVNYPEKVTVIPNGLPRRVEVTDTLINFLRERGLPEDKKIILYVANFEKGKDQLRAINIFNNLDNLADAHLVLVGSSYNKYYKK